MKLRYTTKKQKAREDFCLILGLINFVAMIYPRSCYLQADSMAKISEIAAAKLSTRCAHIP